ncbi:MAG: 3-deoxy-8-phosphooctulonate synthase [Gammaproteobacteria bacterium]|nr:3-deoxy-8-phosphooctulonate synthase [Gammaproteobacteria bacterium]
MTHKQIDIANISVANNLPLVLFGGLNVLESRDLTLSVAENFKTTCAEIGIPFVFKASFDKANRSSINSFRGPGLEEGLNWLAEVKSQFNIPIITDIHEPDQAAAVSEIADVLQLPAFLSRQTDLVVSMAKTGAAINIKKAQFLAPQEMAHILNKFESAGNQRLILCERGSSFGYNNLVVDMLGFSIMKQFGYPVIFDVTHALQKPGGLANSADGRRQQATALAKAGLSQGIAGLFLEAHPDPDNALCDGPCALRLDQLKPFLQQMLELDRLIKDQPDIDTA